MPRHTDISSILIIGAGPIPSPRRGEGGARSASGEGRRAYRWGSAPSPSAALRLLPLPAGERVVAGNRELAPDGFKHASRVLQDVVVPEANDAIAEGFDDLRAVSVGQFAVLSPVQLNGDAGATTGEVGDVGADLFLADELGTRELAVAQMPPKALFGIGLIATKLAGDGGQFLSRQVRAPSPQPSPLRGEGVKAALLHA